MTREDWLEERMRRIITERRFLQQNLLTDSDLREVSVGDVIVVHARREFKQ